MNETSVRIDRDKCIGAGQCEAIAPETFAVGEDNLSRIIDADAKYSEKIRRAIEACPMGAVKSSQYPNTE